MITRSGFGTEELGTSNHRCRNACDTHLDSYIRTLALENILQIMRSYFETNTEDFVLEEEVSEKEKHIVLFNDDINTFDHVIESLIDICRHGILQAEQCAIIVHNNGKCSVKEGSYERLEPMCTALLDRGLSAEIH